MELTIHFRWNKKTTDKWSYDYYRRGVVEIGWWVAFLKSNQTIDYYRHDLENSQRKRPNLQIIEFKHFICKKKENPMSGENLWLDGQ